MREPALGDDEAASSYGTRPTARRAAVAASSGRDLAGIHDEVEE